MSVDINAYLQIELKLLILPKNCHFQMVSVIAFDALKTALLR